VILVPVGIDDDRYRVRGQLSQVLEDFVTLPVAASRVDHERFAVTEDDADLLVELNVSPREDAIADLEPGTRPRRHERDRTRCASPPRATRPRRTLLR